MDKAFVDLIEKNIPYNIEFKICRPNDGKILDIRSVVNYDKESNSIFGIIHDISEQKKAEKEISALSTRLQHYIISNPSILYSM